MIEPPPPPLPPLWSTHIQRLRLATFERGIRLAGFTSLKPQSGVSTLCAALASATAASGVKTLLVDLSQPSAGHQANPLWLPGEGGALVAIPSGGSSFDRLTGQASATTRDLFNNSSQLRRTLMDELSAYAALIVDLPPLHSEGRQSIDPASAAAACGNVYLVCIAGETTKSEVSEAVERLHSAGVEVLGLVVNDVRNPTLGAELAREVRRFRRLAPKLTIALERKLLNNEFLNR